MNLKVGKYYTLDIKKFISYNRNTGNAVFCGISPKDIDIFENNKSHKCVFCEKGSGDSFAIYFEGQTASNTSTIYGRPFWFYYNNTEDCFKECNQVKQEEMEI